VVPAADRRRTIAAIGSARREAGRSLSALPAGAHRDESDPARVRDPRSTVSSAARDACRRRRGAIPFVGATMPGVSGRSAALRRLVAGVDIAAVRLLVPEGPVLRRAVAETTPCSRRPARRRRALPRFARRHALPSRDEVIGCPARWHDRRSVPAEPWRPARAEARLSNCFGIVAKRLRRLPAGGADQTALVCFEPPYSGCDFARPAT